MILVLGLGRMGLPMAAHLLRAGQKVVGYDPSPSRMALLANAGGRPADDLGAALREAEAVMVMVGAEQQVASLFRDEVGVLKKCKPGALALVISTVSPELVATLGEEASRSGVRVVDAPVCRAEMGAIAGSLLAFLSGDKEDCRKAGDLMRAFSSDIEYVGERLGAAQVAKTINNLILWACVVANDEGLRLADAWGLDAHALRRALVTSSADNWSLRHWDKIGEMPWSIKDMEIALKTAAASGLDLPLAKTIDDRVRKIDVLNHG